MNQEHDPEHDDLRDLFAATAEAPSTATLTRFEAHAARVPGRARLRRWVPVSLLAAAAAALATLWPAAAPELQRAHEVAHALSATQIAPSFLAEPEDEGDDEELALLDDGEFTAPALDLLDDGEDGDEADLDLFDGEDG